MQRVNLVMDEEEGGVLTLRVTSAVFSEVSREGMKRVLKRKKRAPVPSSSTHAHHPRPRPPWSSTWAP